MFPVVRMAQPTPNASSGELVAAWTRVEVNERRFVEACADHTDGVVIAHRFDTPPLPGSPDAALGKTGSELKTAALRSRVPFLVELETWRLPYLQDHDDDSFGRDARTAVGAPCRFRSHRKLWRTTRQRSRWCGRRSLLRLERH